MRIHEGEPILHEGAAIEDAQVIVILLHGRGSSAEDMLGLAERLDAPGVKTAFLAPQAAGSSWYPQRFLAPLSQNEPYLASALGVVDGIVATQVVHGKFPRERILIAGFSQGACLALEYAARHPGHYAGIAGLSGALIGPPGMERRSTGSLQKTPVFLGCGDSDFHIPLASVHESTEVFRRMGAEVTERIYPHLPHTVNEDEIAMVKSLIARAAPR